MPRQRYIQHNGELIPAEEYYSREYHAPMVIPDIQPYQSQVTGEMITSRSQHREHLKRHGMIEIGNEIDCHMKQKQRPDDREARRRTIAEVLNSKGY